MFGGKLWSKFEPYVREGVGIYKTMNNKNDYLILVNGARLQFVSIRFWSKKFMSNDMRHVHWLLCQHIIGCTCKIFVFEYTNWIHVKLLYMHND